jgi:hypothetical protein
VNGPQGPQAPDYELGNECSGRPDQSDRTSWRICRRSWLAKACYLIDKFLGPAAEATFLDSVGTGPGASGNQGRLRTVIRLRRCPGYVTSKSPISALRLFGHTDVTGVTRWASRSMDRPFTILGLT